jgi:hypothetical protein
MRRRDFIGWLVALPVVGGALGRLAPYAAAAKEKPYIWIRGDRGWGDLRDEPVEYAQFAWFNSANWLDGHGPPSGNGTETVVVWSGILAFPEAKHVAIDTLIIHEVAGCVRLPSNYRQEPWRRCGLRDGVEPVRWVSGHSRDRPPLCEKAPIKGADGLWWRTWGRADA